MARTYRLHLIVPCLSAGSGVPYEVLVARRARRLETNCYGRCPMEGVLCNNRGRINSVLRWPVSRSPASVYCCWSHVG